MRGLAGRVRPKKMPAAREALVVFLLFLDHGVGCNEGDDCDRHGDNDCGGLLCACHAVRIPQLGVKTRASLRRSPSEVGGLARGIHDDRYRHLVEALYDARRKAGLSQTDLAKRLGKRQQFVSKYEGGERRLDIVEFVDIGRALGLDISILIREIPPV